VVEGSKSKMNARSIRRLLDTSRLTEDDRLEWDARFDSWVAEHRNDKAEISALRLGVELIGMHTSSLTEDLGYSFLNPPDSTRVVATVNRFNAPRAPRQLFAISGEVIRIDQEDVAEDEGLWCYAFPGEFGRDSDVFTVSTFNESKANLGRWIAAVDQDPTVSVRFSGIVPFVMQTCPLPAGTILSAVWDE
jgi:hypothetical protein